MVPRALRKREGGGVMVESWEGHWEVSGEMRGWSFGSLVAKDRLAKAWTEVMVGRERRVDRIWLP